MRYLLLAVVLAAGCVPEPDVQDIVDRAIAFHGGELLNRAELTFDFRDRQFRVLRNNGVFEYERVYVDTTGANVREVLSNEGLFREVNGSRVELDSASHRSAETGVNSVVYFAILPLPLNDPAARKQLLGTTTIEGRTYHEVEVTFVPEGGGRDYDDRFIYWFNTETAALDYLAYYFHVDDGGSRFRKAYNVRDFGGVKLADYYNYKSESDLPMSQVERYDSVFTAGGLELVSEVNLENVQVRFLD